MDVTKKELLDFINNFGDPKDYNKLDNRTRNSIKKLREACSRYWFYSKPDDYIISDDHESSFYKFKELLSDTETISKYELRVKNGEIKGYLDLYAILKRDKLIERCISK